MSYNPNHRELTPQEKLEMMQLQQAVENGTATKKQKTDYALLKFKSESW